MRRPLASRGTLIFAIALVVAAPLHYAAAQGGGGNPAPGAPGAPGTPRTRADSLKLRGDTAQARRDSIKNLPLVHWDPADSVGLVLMKMKGYRVVRYKAHDVDFGAQSRTIVLTGAKRERAAVEREPSTLVADTITYSDTASLVKAQGDTITMRDPTRGEDVIARGKMAYNLTRKEGLGTYVSTSTRATGQQWIVKASGAAFSGDTTVDDASAFYGLNGTITSCEDSIPHYYFKAQEIKRVAGSVMVARPAILYIMDVPVMWFPFIFQDSREGRRSGILTPQFGITELVRNSPNYRRTVNNIGYYFALSDYYDAQVSLDWRSSAMATDEDPGWVRLNGVFRYKWLDRFMTGALTVSNNSLSNGSSNLAISWAHQEDFSLHSHLTINFNYATNTTVQRQTVISPLAAVSTIASQANYLRDIGDFSISIGGTQRQYPGRPQVDRSFPSLNITSKPISLASWLVWTPTFQASATQSLHMDSQGDFASIYSLRSDGTLDSTAVDRSNKTSSITFGTPFKIGDTQLQLAVRANSNEDDYPQLRTIVDPVDTSKRSTRVYNRTYLNTVDFDINMNLPTIRLNFLNLDKLNLVPSVTVANVDPGAYFVRSERTGADWVSQSKRLSYALSMSPTFFALFDGIGPIEKIRHTFTPTFSYSYSPYASLNPEYLVALGESPVGYIGNEAQNRVTLSIAQVFEAKLRMHGDSAITNPEAAKKYKVLSLNFTPVTWDFERAKLNHGQGFATDNFGYTVRSDLLPGFDFSANYSLFQGSVLSDTAKFSPYLTSIQASFNLDGKSGIVRFIGRLFGIHGDSAGRDTLGTARDTSGSRLGGIANVAAQQSASGVLPIQPVHGFDAALTFTQNRQRPPVGGTVIQYDPTLQCAPLQQINPLQYDLCVRNAQAAPPQDLTNTLTTAGGSFIRYPPQTNIGLRTNFNLTDKWSASWNTNYDVERGEFGSQTVSLQRDLHDWRAIFGFTQAPNGNFAFTFFISLKAEPDVKFNYDRSSYRLPSGTVPSP